MAYLSQRVGFGQQWSSGCRGVDRGSAESGWVVLLPPTLGSYLNHQTVLVGLQVSPSMLSDFMTSLTASPHSHPISFQEFRDFLLLLPRRVSTKEIYRFYEVRKFLGDDGRGAARVTMSGAFSLTHRGHLKRDSVLGDVSLSAEDKPPNYLIYRPPVMTAPLPLDHDLSPTDSENDHDHDPVEEHHHIEDDHHGWLGGTMALKYLAAGGVAGAGQPPHASRRHSSC